MRSQTWKYAAISGGVLFSLGMAPAAWAANLLINPGFESPTAIGSTSSTATGWTFYADAQRATFFNNTPGGMWSDWIKSFEPLGGVTQTVSGITGGSTYTLSALFYFEASYPNSGATSDLKLTWDVGSPTELDLAPGSVSTGAWTPYTLSAVAPAGASSVTVSFDWTGGSTTSGAQSGFVDDADLEGAGAPPTTAVWALTGSGDWNVSGNWSTGSVPNGVGQEADFFGAITANHNVYSDIAITAGTLNFNNSNTYVIDGAGSLTMQATTGNALVIVQAGTQKINLPTTIASNTVFNVASGSTLVIGNPLTINSGKTVTQTGAGTVTYQSIVTVQTAGGIVFGNSTHAAGLNLQGTASATLGTHAGGTPSVLELDALSIAGATNNWTGKLDITNNDLIVRNGNQANIVNQIKQGKAGSVGIVSSAEATDPKQITTIGVLLNNDGSGHVLYSSFGGTTGLLSTDVLVKYTYYGDANLDGRVDGSDYTRIDNGYNNGLTGWGNGDFNYDGTVNGSDYTLIDNAFNTQGAAIPGSAPAGLVASSSSQVSAVPEPMTAAAMVFGLGGLLVNRKRKA